MIHFLEISNRALFYYYLACNLSYLVMLIIALKTTAAHQRRLQSMRPGWIKESPLAPPIAVLVPAHNLIEGAGVFPFFHALHQHRVAETGQVSLVVDGDG